MEKVTAKESWETSTILYKKKRKQGKRVIDEEYRRFDDAIAILEWKDDTCIISKIESLAPNTGASSRLVAFLQELADKFNITLWGNVIPYTTSELNNAENYMDQARLEAWYIKRGFEISRGPTVVELFYPKRKV